MLANPLLDEINGLSPAAKDRAGASDCSESPCLTKGFIRPICACARAWTRTDLDGLSFDNVRGLPVYFDG
jgi:hypothetical protein